MEHKFKDGDYCLWCGVARERVEDRRAPWWCDARPEQAFDDGAQLRSEVSGY